MNILFIQCGDSAIDLCDEGVDTFGSLLATFGHSECIDRSQTAVLLLQSYQVAVCLNEFVVLAFGLLTQLRILLLQRLVALQKEMHILRKGVEGLHSYPGVEPLDLECVSDTETDNALELAAL